MSCSSSPAYRPACLLFLLVIGSVSATAQHRRPPHRPYGEQDPIPVRITTVRPYRNMVSLQGHFGQIGGIAEGGLGIAYQRFVNRKGTISVNLPLTFYWGADGDGGEPGYNDVRTNSRGYFAAPGIFWHPAGNRQKVDVALGISVAAGQFNRTTTTYRPPYATAVRYEDPLVACAGEVHLNLHGRRGFLFGFHLSLGRMISESSPPPGETTGSPRFWQFGIKLGGAW